MSSKKQLRRERRKREREEKARGKRNPATLFMIGIVVALLAVAAAAFFWGPDRDEPPFPGATWSEAHGHWH